MRLYVFLFLAILSCKSGNDSSKIKGQDLDPEEGAQADILRENYQCTNNTNTPRYDITIHLGDLESERRGVINGYPIAPGVDVDPIPFALTLMTEQDREKFLKNDGEPRKKYDLLTHSCKGSFADGEDTQFSVDVYQDLVIVKEMRQDSKAQATDTIKTIYLKRLNEEASQYEYNFVVSVGGTFKIELSSNPSTGHKWQIENLDVQRLALDSDSFLATPGGPAGSGGVQVFTFKGLAVGNVEFDLVYKRPWESSSIETKKAKVQVVE